MISLEKMIADNNRTIAINNSISEQIMEFNENGHNSMIKAKSSDIVVVPSARVLSNRGRRSTQPVNIHLQQLSGPSLQQHSSQHINHKDSIQSSHSKHQHHSKNIGGVKEKSRFFNGMHHHSVLSNYDGYQEDAETSQPQKAYPKQTLNNQYITTQNSRFLSKTPDFSPNQSPLKRNFSRMVRFSLILNLLRKSNTKSPIMLNNNILSQIQILRNKGICTCDQKQLGRREKIVCLRI